MPDSPSSAGSLPRRVLAVVVGLFATWQLFYLPAANLIDFVPRRQHKPDHELELVDDTYQSRGTFTRVEPLQRAAEYTGDVLDFWSEVSGQEQGWALFAPGPPPYTVFPAVEFRFPDGTRDTLLSDFEPADIRHPPYRLPLFDDRYFNFEAQFTIAVWYAPPEEVAKLYVPAEEAAKLREQYRQMPDTVRVWRKQIRAWLAWRLKVYRAAHPEREMPVEVILKHRYVPSPKPDEPPEWTRPVQERPYARWRPADDSLEAFDMVNEKFIPIGAKP